MKWVVILGPAGFHQHSFYSTAAKEKKMLQREIKETKISRTNPTALTRCYSPAAARPDSPQFKTVSALAKSRAHPPRSARLRISRSPPCGQAWA